ncbi:hypothetical protein GGTG_11843 [Gaeumannomyces tritici R3-111a-1]|uniref:Uncharacterized protein n=1 Tax=Gaeumannomyces tritici (strain R3-111a-1) TaxID=644352 RepID=J3PEC0_GAET3|nr:hypothetical protein GGTG_11843 [Gaeumannomyces tritici R3-111a-1]EJT70820.1 hypothetical protein GGTG_11843 [Gaeumannomyces tritici R3-111a-1]
MGTFARAALLAQGTRGFSPPTRGQAIPHEESMIATPETLRQSDDPPGRVGAARLSGRQVAAGHAWVAWMVSSLNCRTSKAYYALVPVNVNAK